MINIKDKLRRTSINIKRTAGSVDYVSLEKFEDDVQDIREEIEGLNSDLSDYTTIEDFNRSMAQIDTKIDDILEAIENNDGKDYNEGYSDGLIAGDTRGYNRGIADQKAKLESITIVRNGTYTKDDGYNNILVDVPTNNTGDYDDGYSDGYTNGISEQKAKLEGITITENGTYTKDDGYGKVIVDVPNVSGDDLDFTQIGYTTAINKEVNEMLKNDIEYAYNLANNGIIKGSELVFAPSADYSNMTKVDFENCVMLQVVPPIYLPEVESMKGMFRFCYSLRKVYQIQAPKATSAYRMFGDCQSLKVAPYIYAPNLTNAKEMFYHCYYLESVPEFNTTNVTDMSSMFYGCLLLESVPEFNTTNVSNMSGMFYGCTSLESVPEFDTTNVTDVSSMFGECLSLQSLPAFECGKVENIKFLFSAQRNSVAVNDLKGFYNLKIDWNDDGGLACCPTLTYQSFMNVINSLYNFRANGDTTTTKTLKIHQNTMDLLGDGDIALAISKGWVITA